MSDHTGDRDETSNEEHIMDDDRIVYMDEDGNEIDPSELGDGWIIEDADEGATEAAPGPAPDEAQDWDEQDDEDGFEQVEFEDFDDEPVSLGGGFVADTADDDDFSPVMLPDDPEDDEPEPVPVVAHKTPDPADSSDGGGSDGGTGDTAQHSGLPRPLIFGGAGLLVAAVAAAGIGLWMWQGPSNTVAEVKAQVEEATQRELPEIDACDGTMVRDAEITGRGEAPTMRLEVVEAVRLPPQMAQRLRDQGSAAKVQILQKQDRSLTIYIDELPIPPAPGERKSTPPEFPWWTATVDTRAGLGVVGEEGGTGGDADAASACPSVASVGAYAVDGKVPASAKGMREGQAEVSALKPDGAEPNIVFMTAGDQLLKAELTWDEEEAESQMRAEEEAVKDEAKRRADREAKKNDDTGQ